jgi:hypothetical protein
MDSDYYETGKTILKNEKNMVLQNPNFQQSIIDRNKYYYQKSIDTLIIIYTICFFIYIVGAAIIYTYIIRYKPYSMVFKLIVLPLLITFPFYIFHFQRYLFMAMDYIYRYFLTYVFNDGYKFINKNVTQLILSTSKKNKELSEDDTSKGDASKGDKIRRFKLDDIGKTKKERDAADRLKKGDNTTYWTLVNSIKTIVTNYIETSDELKPDELKPLDYATIYINDITSNDKADENIVILATISERILASYIWRIKQMQDQVIQDQDITDTWKTIAITILENDWLKTQITKQEIQSMRIKYAFDMIKLFDNKSTDPMIIQSIKTQISDNNINEFIGTNNLQIVTSHSIYVLSLLMYKSNSLAYETEKSKKILALSLIGKYAAYAYPQYHTFNTMDIIQNTNLTGDVSLLNDYLISQTNKLLEIKSHTSTNTDIKNLIDLSIYIRKNAGQDSIIQLTSIVSAFETVINIILLSIDYNTEILYSILGNSYSIIKPSIIKPNQGNIAIDSICNEYLSLLNYIKTTATVSDVKTYFTPIIQYITNIYNLLPSKTITIGVGDLISSITDDNCIKIIKTILSLTTTHMLIQCNKSETQFLQILKVNKDLSKKLVGLSPENTNFNDITSAYEPFINYTSYKIHPYTSKNTLSYSQL